MDRLTSMRFVESVLLLTVLAFVVVGMLRSLLRFIAVPTVVTTLSTG